MLQSKDPKGQSCSFSYNGVGQPTAANLPGETVSYGYGANGRTESVTDNRGATTIEAGNDRVASVTDPVTRLGVNAPGRVRVSGPGRWAPARSSSRGGEAPPALCGTRSSE